MKIFNFSRNKNFIYFIKKYGIFLQTSKVIKRKLMKILKFYTQCFASMRNAMFSFT